MLHLTTAVVVVMLTVAGVAAAAWMARRQRQCPRCAAELRTVAPPDGLHTYEVLACPRCETAVTLSQGARRRFSFCPRCGQRSLSTAPHRHPDPPGGVLVEVEEACHLCGWSDRRFCTAEGPGGAAGAGAGAPRGVVLSFPAAPKPDQ